MQEVFYLSKVVTTENGILVTELLPESYETYGDALAAAQQTPGLYQVQKFFVVAH